MSSIENPESLEPSFEVIWFPKERDTKSEDAVLLPIKKVFQTETGKYSLILAGVFDGVSTSDGGYNSMIGSMEASQILSNSLEKYLSGQLNHLTLEEMLSGIIKTWEKNLTQLDSSLVKQQFKETTVCICMAVESNDGYKVYGMSLGDSRLRSVTLENGTFTCNQHTVDDGQEIFGIEFDLKKLLTERNIKFAEKEIQNLLIEFQKFANISTNMSTTLAEHIYDFKWNDEIILSVDVANYLKTSNAIENSLGSYHRGLPNLDNPREPINFDRANFNFTVPRGTWLFLETDGSYRNIPDDILEDLVTQNSLAQGNVHSLRSSVASQLKLSKTPYPKVQDDASMVMIYLP